jgi:hypothetical protein
MPSATDPLQRFLRRHTLMIGACWIGVALAALWAFRLPVLVDPVIATVPGGNVTIPAKPPAIDVATWNVGLWRPFSNESQPVAVQPSATAPKLYSILQQGDGLTAAIAPAPTAGLVYLKAGDTSHGFTVVRVETDGVVVLINGQEQRLGLGP